MSNSLLGLRHNIVIGSDDDDGNVGYLSTTSTHGGEGFVTGSIEECYMAAILKLYIVCTDVLGNATCLTGNYIGLTHIVEQRCLTMVYVTHHGNNWSTGYQISLIVLLLDYSLANLGTYIFCLETILFGNDVDGLGIQTLVDADHDTDAHTCTNNAGNRHVHHGGQFIGSNELGEFQHLVLCHLVHHLLFHLFADGLALFTTILGTLAHLVVLGSETSQCLANLLCNLFLANLYWLWMLLWLVLLLVLGLLALTLTLLLLVGCGVVLVALTLLALALALLLLRNNGIDINLLLSTTDALLLTVCLSLLLFLFTLALALILRLLLRTSALVQSR